MGKENRGPREIQDTSYNWLESNTYTKNYTPKNINNFAYYANEKQVIQLAEAILAGKLRLDSKVQGDAKELFAQALNTGLEAAGKKPIPAITEYITANNTQAVTETSPKRKIDRAKFLADTANHQNSQKNEDLFTLTDGTNSRTLTKSELDKIIAAQNKSALREQQNSSSPMTQPTKAPLPKAPSVQPVAKPAAVIPEFDGLSTEGKQIFFDVLTAKQPENEFFHENLKNQYRYTLENQGPQAFLNEIKNTMNQNASADVKATDIRALWEVAHESSSPTQLTQQMREAFNAKNIRLDDAELPPITTKATLNDFPNLGEGYREALQTHITNSPATLDPSITENTKYGLNYSLQIKGDQAFLDNVSSTMKQNMLTKDRALAVRVMAEVLEENNRPDLALKVQGAFNKLGVTVPQLDKFVNSVYPTHPTSPIYNPYAGNGMDIPKTQPAAIASPLGPDDLLRKAVSGTPLARMVKNGKLSSNDYISVGMQAVTIQSNNQKAAEAAMAGLAKLEDSGGMQRIFNNAVQNNNIEITKTLIEHFPKEERVDVLRGGIDLSRSSLQMQDYLQSTLTTANLEQHKTDFIKEARNDANLGRLVTKEELATDAYIRIGMQSVTEQSNNKELALKTMQVLSDRQEIGGMQRIFNNAVQNNNIEIASSLIECFPKEERIDVLRGGMNLSKHSPKMQESLQVEINKLIPVKQVDPAINKLANDTIELVQHSPNKEAAANTYAAVTTNLLMLGAPQGQAFVNAANKDLFLAGIVQKHIANHNAILDKGLVPYNKPIDQKMCTAIGQMGAQTGNLAISSAAMQLAVADGNKNGICAILASCNNEAIVKDLTPYIPPANRMDILAQTLKQPDLKPGVELCLRSQCDNLHQLHEGRLPVSTNVQNFTNSLVNNAKDISSFKAIVDVVKACIESQDCETAQAFANSIKSGKNPQLLAEIHHCLKDMNFSVGKLGMANSSFPQIAPAPLPTSPNDKAYLNTMKAIGTSAEQCGLNNVALVVYNTVNTEKNSGKQLAVIPTASTTNQTNSSANSTSTKEAPSKTNDTPSPSKRSIEANTWLPEQLTENDKNLFNNAVTGLNINIDILKTKQGYRNLALLLHPDKVSGEAAKQEATKKFDDITNLYEKLHGKNRNVDNATQGTVDPFMGNIQSVIKQTNTGIMAVDVATDTARLLYDAAGKREHVGENLTKAGLNAAHLAGMTGALGSYYDNITPLVGYNDLPLGISSANISYNPITIAATAGKVAHKAYQAYQGEITTTEAVKSSIGLAAQTAMPVAMQALTTGTVAGLKYAGLPIDAQTAGLALGIGMTLYSGYNVAKNSYSLWAETSAEAAKKLNTIDLFKDAIDANETATIADLSKKHQELNDADIDNNGQTLLSYAVEKGKHTIAAQMIKEGFQPELSQDEMMYGQKKQTPDEIANTIGGDVLIEYKKEKTKPISGVSLYSISPNATSIVSEIQDPEVNIHTNKRKNQHEDSEVIIAKADNRLNTSKPPILTKKSNSQNNYSNRELLERVNSVQSPRAVDEINSPEFNNTDRWKSIKSKSPKSKENIAEIEKADKILLNKQIQNNEHEKTFMREDPKEQHATVKETRTDEGFKYEVTGAKEGDVHIVQIPMLDKNGNKQNDVYETLFLDHNSQILAHKLTSKMNEHGKYETLDDPTKKTELFSQLNATWLKDNQFKDPLSVSEAAIAAVVKGLQVTNISSSNGPEGGPSHTPIIKEIKDGQNIGG